jgi:hypothetical protein
VPSFDDIDELLHHIPSVLGSNARLIIVFSKTLLNVTNFIEKVATYDTKIV